MPKEYKAIDRGSVTELAEMVNVALEEGWELWGSMTSAASSHTIVGEYENTLGISWSYCQALVRDLTSNEKGGE